jgi:hypothetical protein
MKNTTKTKDTSKKNKWTKTDKWGKKHITTKIKKFSKLF